MANFEAKVKAVLDTASVSSFASRLESELSRSPIHINSFDVSASNIRSQIEAQLKQPFDITINTNSVVNSGKNAAQALQTSFNSVLNQRQKNRVGSILSNMGFDSDAVTTVTDRLEKDINKFQLKVTKISQSYSTKKGKNSGSRLSVQGYDEVGNLIELTKQWDKLGKESTNTRIISSFQEQSDAIKNTSGEFSKLTKLQQQWSKLRVDKAKLDPVANAKEYAEVERQINGVSTAYVNLYKQQKQNLTNDQDSELAANFSKTTDAIKKIRASSQDAQTSAINSLNKGISDGTFENQFNKVLQDYGKLDKSNFELEASITRLKNAYAGMNDPGNSDRLLEQEKFNDALKVSKDLIADINREQKDSLKNDTLQNKANAAISNINDWMNKNPRAAAAYGSEIDAIIEKLKDPALDGQTFSNLTSRLNAFKASAKEAGLTTSPLVQNLKQLLGIGSTIAIMRKAVQTVKQMAQETVKVDTAMTELYRVTNLSQSEYVNLYDDMVASAKEYGAELNTMINATASWVRLGFDAKTANKLAEVSTMYQHVTDLDEKTAVNNLVTAYMGYKDSLLELTGGDEVTAITRISDVFDKLGNELPVTAANVAEGMTKNASVMQSAGASFEQAAAMVVGSGSVSQDFAKSGTALKIFALRVRGMKGELEELGEEVDDNVQSVSKMQTQILNYTKGAVNIFEADGKTFRNIYDIAKDLAEVLPTLDEKDQAALLETVAGKSRSNDILNLLTNFKMTEKALDAANRAAGTASKENEVYMDSIQGRMDVLKASWQALSADFVQSDLIKGLVSGATAFLDILDATVGKLGIVGTLFTGGAIYGGIKAFKSLS